MAFWPPTLIFYVERDFITQNACNSFEYVIRFSSERVEYKSKHIRSELLLHHEHTSKEVDFILKVTPFGSPIFRNSNKSYFHVVCAIAIPRTNRISSMEDVPLAGQINVYNSMVDFTTSLRLKTSNYANSNFKLL